MKKSAEILFQLIDQQLELSVTRIKDVVFAVSEDEAWSPEQRAALQPAIQAELEALVQGIFEVFAHAGGGLSDEEVALYTIEAVSAEQIEGISDGTTEYPALWQDYLANKESR